MRTRKIVLTIVIFAAFQIQNAVAQSRAEIAFESEILRILQENNVPGAGVALLSKNKIIWTGMLGQADVKNHVPVTRNTLFTIGSISKTFLSAAAMVAQERGILDINDPIEELVPSVEYTNRWNNTDPVRLVHLLEHTSGFDEAHFNLFPQTNSSTPLGDIMEKSRRSLETRWKPGHYFEYNTLGYITAAHVIEGKVSMPFDEFVRENLLLPLEMNWATYHPEDSINGNFSKGYKGNRNEEVPFPSIPQWPAGSLTTTVGGLSNFLCMLLNNGRFKNNQILTPASVKQMETPETSLYAQAGVTYGYGKGILGKFENGHLFYGHSGRYGGFLSEFGYSRELDLGYVILINSADGGKAIKAIKSLLLSSLVPPENEHTRRVSKAMISEFEDVTGCYQAITSVPQLGQIGYFVYRLIDMPIIEEENGQLFQSTIFGDRQELLHVRDLTFRSRGESIATSAFIAVQDENWQWLTSDASYRKIPVWWGFTQFYIALICVFLIVTGFISFFFWIPVQLIRKRLKDLLLQLFPFLAICSLLGMIASIVLFFDPEKMYSTGAILFFIFGWLFLALSLLSLIKVVIVFYKKVEVNVWVKYHALSVTLACCLCAAYLLYWNILGLTLWNY